jgi:RHS repeat-associated protein
MKASFPANAGSRLEKTMRLSAKLVAVSSVLALFAGGGTWALAAMTELHPIGKGNLSNGNTTTGKTPFTGNTGASSTSTLTTTSTSTSPCGLCDTTTATLDGMGQLIRTQHPSVWGRMIEVDGSYDQLGRLSGESNPYFPPGFGGSDATTGSTYHSYDGLNREVKTTLADGSTTSVSYQGNCTVHTDGAGATTKSCVDGLGRLTSVAEPGPAAGTASDPTGLLDAYVTLYFYGTDASGNSTTCIEQHGTVASSSGCSAPPSADATSLWRIRRAVHDSAGRLISASNPETGTITYTYDANGNMTSETHPAPNQPAASTATVTVSYSYDQLNRVVGEYNGATTNSPTMTTYAYDSGTNAIGRQVLMANGAASRSMTYDGRGHLMSEKETINGVTNTTSYTYHLNDSLASVQLPSGLIITYAINQDGNLVSAVDQLGNIYVSNTDYNASELLQGVVTGTTVQHTLSYNTRLQPTRIQAQSRNSSTGAIGATIFDISYDFHQGQGDNGNVHQVVNNRDPSRSQTFGYDALNRIVTGYNAGTDCSQVTQNGHNKYWGQNFTYDPWGNLYNVSIFRCNAESFATSANPKNQFLDLLYDAAGNVVSNGTVATYDVQNRLVSYNGETYAYDGDDVRVIKTNGTDGTIYWGSPFGTLMETDLKGNIEREYVYFNGSRIALITHSAGTTQTAYYLSDFLGSSAMLVDRLGNILNESDFTPFGGERVLLSAVANPYRYAGKEYDPESGFDYFGARYDIPGMGRFLTPDWSGSPSFVPYAKLENPQSLNLYAYAKNNPTSYRDIDGHQLGEFGTGPNIGAPLDPEQSVEQAEMVSKIGDAVKSSAQNLVSAALNASNTNLGIAAFEALNTVKVDLNIGPSFQGQAFGGSVGVEAGAVLGVNTGINPSVNLAGAASAELKGTGPVGLGVGAEVGASTRNGLYGQVRGQASLSNGGGKNSGEVVARAETAHHGKTSVTYQDRQKVKVPLAVGSVSVSADSNKLVTLGTEVVHSSRVLTGVAQAYHDAVDAVHPSSLHDDGFVSSNKRW